MKVEIDLLGLQVAEKANEVLQTAPEAIYRPSRDHVELFPRNGMEQGVEAGPVLAALGAADAAIDVFRNDRPAVAFDRGAKFSQLVLGALAVRGNTRNVTAVTAVVRGRPDDRLRRPDP